MLQFIDRHPKSGRWLIAAAQGATLLGLNVVLRLAVT